MRGKSRLSTRVSSRRPTCFRCAHSRALHLLSHLPRYQRIEACAWPRRTKLIIIAELMLESSVRMTMSAEWTITESTTAKRLPMLMENVNFVLCSDRVYRMWSVSGCHSKPWRNVCRTIQHGSVGYQALVRTRRYGSGGNLPMKCLLHTYMDTPIFSQYTPHNTT